MPTHLTEMDRMGVHRRLLYLELIRLCHKSIRATRGEIDARPLVAASTLHAHRAGGHVLDASTVRGYREILHAFETWEVERFLPAHAQYLKGVAEKRSYMWAEQHAEPAWTFRRLFYEAQRTDFEANRSAAVHAIRLVEPKPVNMAMTDDDVEAFLGVLTAKDPGQKLFYVTKDGKWRLGAEEARNALVSVVGAVEPDTIEPPHGIWQEQELSTKPSTEADDSDHIRAVMEFLRSQRDAAESGSAEAIAADALMREITEGPAALRKVAEQHGVDDSTLGRASRRLRERVAAKFFA
jgi:hypothetical protein